MVEKWMAVYQEETVEKMLASMMEEHPTCIRFDPERISKDTLKARLKEDGGKNQRPSGSSVCVMDFGV